MSLDGCIDDTSAERLVLSGPEDLDRVDELRASCDAILVGAGTIRADDPRLVVRSHVRRAARVASGTAPNPVKVTVTGSGDLDPAARFFAAGDAAKVVYASSHAAARLRARLEGLADIVDLGERADLVDLLADLANRGIGRLMVEGGSSVLTQFLAGDVADELRLAIAPFFVGEAAAPRFPGTGRLPWGPRHPARLERASRAGQDVVVVYALSSRYSPR